MGLLQLVETREGRTKTHLLRIARIDTGHQGLHDPFAGMPSEPATKKRTPAIRRPSTDAAESAHRSPYGQDRSKTTARCEKTGPVEIGVNVTSPSGNSCNCPPLKTLAFLLNRVGVDQLIGKPKSSAELHAPRLLGEERVGPRFHDQLSDSMRDESFRPRPALHRG
jgi:hypothetical protein